MLTSDDIHKSIRQPAFGNGGQGVKILPINGNGCEGL
jgi:hypothetical protein